MKDLSLRELFILIFSNCLLLIGNQVNGQEHFTYNPEKYVCYRVEEPLSIDGDLSEKSWLNAPWTSDFVDIEGDLKPKPAKRTRAKMLWDDQYFYVAAEIIETDIWATYDKRDMVIFHENDFEVFIDPNGDTHHYYELEINALGTEWDLLLTKPYRDGGQAIDSWEILGLKSGIKINGTINDPSDKDDRWFVELAFPWKVLEEAAGKGGKPADGDQWRVNFSRVNWRIAAEDDKYVKETDPSTGKHFPEFNWVWSPQGVIAMHQPETWGFVQFSEIVAGQGKTKFLSDPDDQVKWLLRNIYYCQSAYFSKYREYADDLNKLEFSDDRMTRAIKSANIQLVTGLQFYKAFVSKQNRYIMIDNEGKVTVKSANR